MKLSYRGICYESASSQIKIEHLAGYRGVAWNSQHYKQPSPTPKHTHSLKYRGVNYSAIQLQFS